MAPSSLKREVFSGLWEEPQSIQIYGGGGPNNYRKLIVARGKKVGSYWEGKILKEGTAGWLEP